HFGEACREIGIEAEAVESPDAHPAEAPGVDADQDVEMLILAELARDERAGASRRLPVDAGQGVTGRIGTQLVQLGPGAAHAPQPRERLEAGGHRGRVVNGERTGRGVGELERGRLGPPEKGSWRARELRLEGEPRDEPSLERETEEEERRGDVP